VDLKPEFWIGSGLASTASIILGFLIKNMIKRVQERIKDTEDDYDELRSKVSAQAVDIAKLKTTINIMVIGKKYFEKNNDLTDTPLDD
jgi:hypothetical protein